MHPGPAASPVSALWTAPLSQLQESITGTDAGPAGHPNQAGWVRLLGRQFVSPVTLILVMAAAIAGAVGDLTDALIIAVIVLASALLGFVQEFKATRDVSLLLKRVTATVQVIRNGIALSVPVSEVIPGDVVRLSAGDVIPGDCRLVAALDLSVDESALTGESMPAEKDPAAVVKPDASLASRDNCVFAGTHVVSGTATALVVLVGRQTQFGQVAGRLATKTLPTAFEHGIARFGLLLLRVTLILTIAVFVINVLLGRPLVDALLFSLALAVGVTPQMLPVIVSVSLSVGARALARRKVIVKRLEVIEDLGSLTVLCTDKTGTLTSGAAELHDYLGPNGERSDRVLRLALLNATLQKGYRNPLDEALLLAARPGPEVATGEVPYDFRRKRLSIAVSVDGSRLLVTKGAFEPLLGCCKQVAGSTDFEGVRDLYRKLSADGFRVVGVATRALGVSEQVDASSERGLVLEGLLVFRDELKEGVADDVRELETMGVRVVIVTGDNALVAGALARRIGLPTALVVTGAQIDSMNPTELRAVVAKCAVFAEVEPGHKEEVVAALRASHETVGFLGDGINDSTALHAADVGISVDTAADVAKEAAGIVLLEKSLGVVATGVRLGRRTFANTLKYVRFASSSNFGNVLSMVIASAVLPFLPMLPGQILLLNFLADLPNTLVARDRVDPERLVRPGHWKLGSIQRFMLVFGALSTVFDLLTFALLLWGFHAPEAVFQGAWFIESAMTQMVVLVSLRTSRFFLRSAPDRLFLTVTLAVVVVTFAFPFMPFAAFFGFGPPPLPILACLVGIALLYLVATETVKRFRWTGFDPERAAGGNHEVAMGVPGSSVAL